MSRDLNELAKAHAAEERAEAARHWIDWPRPLRAEVPEGGRLADSRAYLDRFERHCVPEKKPGVFDHLRSWGPWMVSIDQPPLSVLDTMSQTSTVPAGFSPDEVVAAYFDGAFGDTLTAAPDTTVRDHPAVTAFRELLRELLGPGLPHISFTSSGAEANEKALALCLAERERPEARRVLAFEGSFHGRTLLALHATFNPKKRGPYELAGYEARFVPFPAWSTPSAGEPADLAGFRELLAAGRIDELVARYADRGDDLLAAEVASLAAVDEALRGGEIGVCIVEPMQSEGGDRYATGRFFRGLRLLTRHHGVPLIFDEVQTGFGLGGPFMWHRRFGLVDALGQPDGPDAVTFAKRAQVGICASRFVDPEPTAAHPASLVRGRIHAQLAADGGADATRVEALVTPRLNDVAAEFPELIQRPRSRGYAMAFDMPEPALLARYIKQRFWRGAVVFQAGTHTIRYRLNRNCDEPTIDRLFTAINATLTWLREHPGEDPPTWALPLAEEETTDYAYVVTRIRQVEPDEAESVLQEVLALEARVYEPARRDPEARLRRALENPDGIALIAEARPEDEWTLAGYAFACPIEDVPDMPGPKSDPLLGQDLALYSIAISVDPRFRGLGLGTSLKRSQLREAAALERADGSRRYRVVVGRNRVGAADIMTRINIRYGAYGRRLLEGQYGESDGQALYYHSPLSPLAPYRFEPPAQANGAPHDLSDGIAAPFGPGPASLREAVARGELFGPAVNKITICNYISPAVARAVEWVGALTPELPHLYLTSCRDELVDKTVRLLRAERPTAQVAIGLDGGYVGHTSSGARSLSDPAVHRQGEAYFAWPRVPHPSSEDADLLASLGGVVARAGGADKVLGLFVEATQERTGRSLSERDYDQLSTWRTETGIPIVVVETASAVYRSGRGPFASLGLGFVPDALMWWGGGQTGFVHVRHSLYVDTPLGFVSTWDGDELSLIRVHHHLSTAYQLDLSGALQAARSGREAARRLGIGAYGLGLYTVLWPSRTDRLQERLGQRGVRLRSFPNGALAVVPRLDTAEGDLNAVLGVFRTF